MKIKTITKIGILLCIMMMVTFCLIFLNSTQKMTFATHKSAVVKKLVKDMVELKIIIHDYLLHPEERSLAQLESKYDFYQRIY